MNVGTGEQQRNLQCMGSGACKQRKKLQMQRQHATPSMRAAFEDLAAALKHQQGLGLLGPR